jgi:hypothetical protein
MADYIALRTEIATDPLALGPPRLALMRLLIAIGPAGDRTIARWSELAPDRRDYHRPDREGKARDHRPDFPGLSTH